MLRLYTATTCRFCEKAVKWLKDSGIDFIEVSIDEDDKAREYLASKGILAVPVLEYDGKLVVGYSPERYAEVLKREG